MRLTSKDWLLLSFTVFCSVITAVVVLLLINKADKKTAVVDAIRLFNEYKMKQELEGRAGIRLEYFSRQADSLKQEAEIKAKLPAVQRQELEDIYRSAHAAQVRLEEEYEASNRQINEEVWKRLNPLVDEYGRKYGLRLMIGANGMGSVLYNDDHYDHTNELIDFVNRRYENRD